jgi:hypothetical protein
MKRAGLLRWWTMQQNRTRSKWEESCSRDDFQGGLLTQLKGGSIAFIPSQPKGSRPELENRSHNPGKRTR